MHVNGLCPRCCSASRMAFEREELSQTPVSASAGAELFESPISGDRWPRTAKLAGSMMPWVHRSFWLGPCIIAAVLGSLVLLFSSGRLRRVYQGRIEATGRERPFLASVGFFVTAIVVRTI